MVSWLPPNMCLTPCSLPACTHGSRSHVPGRTCQRGHAPVQAVQVLLRLADAGKQLRVEPHQHVGVVGVGARQKVERARHPVRQVEHDDEVARHGHGQQADGQVVLEEPEEPANAVQPDLTAKGGGGGRGRGSARANRGGQRARKDSRGVCVCEGGLCCCTRHSAAPAPDAASGGRTPATPAMRGSTNSNAGFSPNAAP